MKLSIDEYCKTYKISKELLNAKIRQKQLDYVSEDGEIFIVVEDEEPTQTLHQSPDKPKVTIATVLALYEKQSQFLKSKIAHLEDKVDKVTKEKEQILIDERVRIEQIYQNKDEQLKNILELVNKKIKLQRDELESIKIENITSFEVSDDDNLVELKDYLKTLELDKQERKEIKRRFLEVYDKDNRIILRDAKIYLDPLKYDYGDLIELKKS